MQAWLSIDEFSKLVGMSVDKIEELIESGRVKSKIESGELFIEATESTRALLPKKGSDGVVEKQNFIGSDFVEKTIGTILNLHEKVMGAKDETLDALRNENQFLKEALYSMQDLYNEDRKVIDSLSQQLKIAHEDLEFAKKKYKLMWGKAIENASKK